jgi:hypothetical protein
VPASPARDRPSCAGDGSPSSSIQSCRTSRSATGRRTGEWGPARLGLDVLAVGVPCPPPVPFRASVLPLLQHPSPSTPSSIGQSRYKLP